MTHNRKRDETTFDLGDAIYKFGEEIRQSLENGKGTRPGLRAESGLSKRQWRTLIDRVRLASFSTPIASKATLGGDVTPQDTAPAPESPEVEAKQEGDALHVSARGQGLVRNLEELYSVAGIDPELWTADGFQSRTWATPLKKRHTVIDKEGRAHTSDEVVIVRSWYISAKFYRRMDLGVSFPKWEASSTLRTPDPTKPECTLIIPDMQIGFRWTARHRHLEPMHDWAAIDCAIQVAQRLGADCSNLQFLGDSTDLAPFGRYDIPTELRGTTKPSLLATHSILRRFRNAVPLADANHQNGNHDDRLDRRMGSRAIGLEEAVHLAPADDQDGPGITSYARMVGLKDLGFTWQEYGEERWLYGKLRVHHGDLVKSGGGKTVAAQVARQNFSQVFGHIHRQEVAYRTIWGPKGAEIIFAASPGTLCRIDGAVPGVSNRNDWQQGFALAWWDEAEQHLFYENIEVRNGRCMFRGELIVGDGDRLACEVAEEIGWVQVAPPWASVS